MKNKIPLLIAALISFACSVGQFMPLAATPTPVPTETITHTPLPTSTPITPTLTFTSTPTLIGFKTPTLTLQATEIPTLSSVTPLALITPNTLTPTVQLDGLIFVNASETEIYKGAECEPFMVKITAQVIDRDKVSHVLLFARFKSLTSDRASKWTNIEMGTIGAGTYIHDLTSDQMLEDAFFQTAWIEYQIVLTNTVGREIGRSAIFKEKIKMLECIPTPTPIPATVKP